MPAGVTRYVYCPDCQSMTQPATNRHICTRYKEGVVVSRIMKTWNFTLNCWEVAAQETSDNRRDASVEGPMRDVYHPVLKQVAPNTFIRVPEDRAEKEKREVDLEKREMSWQEYLDAKYGPEKTGNKETVEQDYEYSSCEIPVKSEKTEEKHERKCLCLECRPKHIKYHLDTCKCWECYTWKRGKGHEVSYEPHNYRNNYGPTYQGNYSGYQGWKPVKPFEGVDRKKWPNTFINLLKLYFSTGEWYAGKTISDDDYRDRILHQKYKPEPKYNYHYGSYYDHDGA